MNWISFGIAFVIVVILPVWIFTFVDITFFYKIMFTIAGGVGIWLALEKGSIKLHK